MRVSFEEFDAAGDRFVEDPEHNPLPLPCATEGCEDVMMDYDEDEEVYTCPVCGRTVAKEDAEDYLN